MTGFGEIDQNVCFWAKMGYFWQFLPRKGENEIFWEKAKMALPYAYYAATLCKKLEQNHKRIIAKIKFCENEVSYISLVVKNGKSDILETTVIGEEKNAR